MPNLQEVKILTSLQKLKGLYYDVEDGIFLEEFAGAYLKENH